MTDLELLTQINNLCGKADDARCEIDNLLKECNISKDEAWGRIIRLKEDRYISIDISGGIRVLPGGVAYLSDLQQQKKSDHRKNGARVALRILEWGAGIAAAVIGAYLIYRFGLN